MQFADERHVRAWEQLSFECELIRDEEQLDEWDELFRENFKQEKRMSAAAKEEGGAAVNDAVKRFWSAASSNWIRTTAGESELYMCWLEYEGRIIIAVPIYIHLDIAFAQGIRRLYGFSKETSLPGGIAHMGANLLAEVCRHFRHHPDYCLQYLFAYPIAPFCHNLVAQLRETGVACCKHTDHLLPYRNHPYNLSEPTWLRHTYHNNYDLLAIVRPEGDGGRRKDLGVFMRQQTMAWNVLEQRWYGDAWRQRRKPYSQYTPYNFLLGMSGGNFYVIIDAESMADRFAYATQTRMELAPPQYADFPFGRGPPLMEDEEMLEGEHIPPEEALDEEQQADFLDAVDRSKGAVSEDGWGLNAQIVIRAILDPASLAIPFVVSR